MSQGPKCNYFPLQLSCMESPLPFACPLFCFIGDLFIVKHEHIDSERANYTLMGVCTVLSKGTSSEQSYD